MFRVVVYLVYCNWEETPGAKDWEYWNDRYSTPIFEASWNGLRYLNSRGIRPMLALMGPVPDWMTGKNPPPPETRRVPAQGSAQLAGLSEPGPL